MNSDEIVKSFGRVLVSDRNWSEGSQLGAFNWIPLNKYFG